MWKKYGLRMEWSKYGCSKYSVVSIVSILCVLSVCVRSRYTSLGSGAKATLLSEPIAPLVRK